MADTDPQKKAITVATGTDFQLRWTLPHSYGATISFVDASGSQDFPDSKCAVVNAAPVTNAKVNATIQVTVKRGATADALVPDAFVKNRPAPKLTVKWGATGTNIFAAVCSPQAVGIYEFTSVVTITKTAPKGVPASAPQSKTYVETVTCIQGAAVTPKRQAMLDLFNTWLPTSVNGKAYPKKFGDPTNQPNKDILDLCGWSAATPDWSFDEHKFDGTVVAHKGSGLGNKSAAQVACNKQRDADFDSAKTAAAAGGTAVPAKQAYEFTIVTSCGSVLGEFLRLWGCDFDNDGKMSVREMSIADDYPTQNPTQYGAKHYNYWVDAADAFRKPATAGADWQPQYPKAGDVVVLWDDDRHIRAHVCMVVSASEDTWTTAEGGGGALPDQTAGQSNKDVTWKRIDADHPKGIPCILDVTTGTTKRVTGWVDLEKIPNPKYDKKP